MSLEGRVALVTGSSGGLGQAIVAGLAKAGADVMCHYAADYEGAEHTAELVRAHGRNAATARADVRGGSAAAAALVQETVQALGRLDILINNAGVTNTSPFLELTEADWNSVIQTNLTGYFVVAQAAARNMAKAGYGRIVNVSSTRQEQAWHANAAYASSKGGIWMLTRVIALELAPMGIRVNSLAPGTIETDLNRDYLRDDEFRRQRVQMIPVSRLGVPSDVVPAAVLLASDEADFINGATLIVDGGQTIW